MFINMEDMFETHEVVFEIYIKDKLSKKQSMQAPKQIIIANFLQAAQQIQKEKAPMKIRMSTPYVFWDEFEQKQKTLNNRIEYSNDAFIIWEEDNIGKNNSFNN